MNEDLKAFFEARDLFLASGRMPADLVCKVGHEDLPTFKLLKSTWTNDSHELLRNTSGIFFSVWEDVVARERGRLLYNIHALKLRHLRGYRLESRKFADAFREQFDPHRSQWPNVSTKFGPLTLMQGWIPRNPDILTQDIIGLADRFMPLVPLIDSLLNDRKR